MVAVFAKSELHTFGNAVDWATTCVEFVKRMVQINIGNKKGWGCEGIPISYKQVLSELPDAPVVPRWVEISKQYCAI
jgi:hypothetical protein